MNPKPHTSARAQRMKADVKGAQLLTLEKIGVSRFDLSDPYHLALSITWPQFFAGLIAVYLAINFFFALDGPTPMLTMVMPLRSARTRW